MIFLYVFVEKKCCIKKKEIGKRVAKQVIHWDIA
jgi:hypothetical protein